MKTRRGLAVLGLGSVFLAAMYGVAVRATRTVSRGSGAGFAGSMRPTGSGEATSDAKSGAKTTSTSTEQGKAEPTDTTSPQVSTVLPEPNATGVSVHATITVTFSEAMDKQSVETAFQSPDLGNFTFDWRDDQTIVVTPTAALAHASGGPGVRARTFTYRLTTVAKDLAGNELDHAYEATFATQRRVIPLPQPPGCVLPRKAEIWSRAASGRSVP